MLSAVAKTLRSDAWKLYSSTVWRDTSFQYMNLDCYYKKYSKGNTFTAPSNMHNRVAPKSVKLCGGEYYVRSSLLGKKLTDHGFKCVPVCCS